MPYTVGHNMPGYMPESDPWITADYESAKGSLIDNMERAADFHDDSARAHEEAGDIPAASEEHTYAEELSAACEDLNLCTAGDENGGAFGVTIGNMHYWLSVVAWDEVEDYGALDDGGEMAIAYLTREGWELRVPCSRYGSDSDDCAPIAWRISELTQRESGEPITTDTLDGSMSWVVTDSDTVAEVLAKYGTDEERAEWGSNLNILRDDSGQVVCFAFPGGYRVWYVADDGGTLCAECVQENYEQCNDGRHRATGWYVVGHYSEADTEPESIGPCDHCGRTADVGEGE